MSKIHSLHINNFKFFRVTSPIELKGNHLLLYGENGSGKSSIYWSLYTLFEASLKNHDDEIKKYFCKSVKKEDSLVNIHAVETEPATDNYNSFIEVVTTSNPAIAYKASKTDVAIRTDLNAKFTNYASDFINYKLLLSFSAFRHSKAIDLYEMFVEHIFKYVNFLTIEVVRRGDPKMLINAFDIWSYIEEGPDEFDKAHEYTPEEVQTYKESPPYQTFVRVVDAFNERVENLVSFINIHGPSYFKLLGYDFDYSLTYTKASFKIRSKKYRLKPFSIGVKIPSYETVNDSIHRPHSFLNEAKLSALAISIRLAILRQKLNENCLKFIVLDDLLVSLDMRNREKVLSLLLSPEFSDNYQLLILTHDRMFYQIAKHKIRELSQQNWIYYEMHEKKEQVGSSPLILEEVGYLNKAFEFFKIGELEIAANFLRKEAESFCKAFLPSRISLNSEGRHKNLESLIVESVEFAKQIGFDPTLFNILNRHRKFILNPGSHDSYDVPKFRNEIEECHLNLSNLRLIKIETFLPRNSEVYFDLATDEGDWYGFALKTAEDLKILKEPGKDSVLPKCHLNYEVYKNGYLLPGTKHGVDSIKLMFEKNYSKSNKAKSNDFWREVVNFNLDKTLEEIRPF